MEGLQQRSRQGGSQPAPCTYQTQCIREQERARIAREIHDELSQLLTAIKIEVHVIVNSDKAGDSMVKEQLSRVVVLVNETSRALERIGTELRPGVLDRLGLIAAINWQANEFEKRTGVKSEVVIGGNVNVDADRSLNIFRIYQEALANVNRHSGATCVNTRLELKENRVSLFINDNGRGFDLNNVNMICALGLTGMKERASMLGGNLVIESSPGKGTTICLTIPLNSAADNERSNA